MALDKPDKPKESSDLSKFNINRLTTDAGLVEFAKLAQNASQNDLKKWGKTTITTQPGGASFGDTSYSDYLHRRLGIKGNEINNTTINALKKIAESGKITRIPYTTQTKGKEVAHTSAVKKAREATKGTQSIESIVSIKNEGVTQDNAKKILELLPASNGLPTKKAVEMWDRILLSEKQAIQQNIGTKDDGILGRKTLLALQKRANNEVYAGDNFEFPRNPVVDRKLTSLASTVSGTPTVATDTTSATTSTVDNTAVTTGTGSSTEVTQVTPTSPVVASSDTTTPQGKSTVSNDVPFIAPAKVANSAPTTPDKTTTESATVVTEAAIKKPEVSSNVLSSLNETYNTELQEVAKQFDPDKYTYVSFKFETQDKAKVNKVYQIDTNALKAEGIDDITKQNSFMLMHMVSLGGKAMPKYFRDIDTLSSNTIPGNLNGLNRLDYVNSLLKSQGKEIKPNILSDVNGLGVGLKKTLLPFGLDKLVGLGKTGNESVDADERKSEMNKIQSKIDQKNAKIFEANNKDNLGEHYVQILANAKSMDELVKRSETDPILQDILSTFNITKNPQDKLGLLAEDPLEKIKLNIAKQGKDHFKKTIGDFIDERSSEGFIVRNTNFLFDDVTLQSITSKDGSGILKGNMDGSREIYLSAQRLDLNAAKLSYTKDGKSMELSNEAARSFTGQTIDLGMQQSNASPEVQAMMKETKIRIDNNGVAYLITSPKYISTLSQIMNRTGDALTSKTAIEVYKIVGTVLLTLKLAGNHIGTPNIGTPNFPSIDVNLPGLHTPDISSLNTALGGYVLTGLILNRKIALLEGDQRKTSEKSNANGLLQKIATKDGPETLAKVKEAIVESNTTETK